MGMSIQGVWRPGGCSGARGLWVLLTSLLLSWGLICAAPSTATEHDPVRSAAEIDYPPFSIVDEEGRASGFSVELLRAALAAMGREVTFRTGPWAEVRGWLESGEVEALPLVGRTPERELLFDFTFPYMSLHGAVVVREETTGIGDLEDLRGRQVAVMEGDNAEEFLRREDRGIHVRTTKTFEEALRELSRGRHDAVVIQRLVALRLIQETGLTNLRVTNRPIEGFRQDFCFAVREGDRDTLAMLNEGLALVMADGTYRHLHAKWFAALELPTHRPVVIGGDHNYPPYEYLDEQGRPSGYNVDLTRAVARELGLDIRIRLGPWGEMRNALEQGEIDALQGMLYSPERDQVLDFTPPHIVHHYVGVVRDGEGPPPATVSDLTGMRIVAQESDIMHDFALENGLGDRLALVDAQEDALRELAGGRHDCALVARMSALYWMDKHGWGNLNVGRRPILSPGYCYAVPQGQKALLAQLSEGLKVLDESGEYRRIYKKWMGVYEESPGLRTILRYAAMVTIPVAVIILASLMWSWSLRKQVGRRTRELRESAGRFRSMFESANVGKSITLPTGEVHVNRAFADFLGYTREELRGKKWQDLTPAHDIETIEKLLAPLLAGETDAVRFEKRYVHKSGALLWADVSTAMIRDVRGAPLHFITTVVDITERKRAQKALHDSEEFQRAMVACSPVALYTIDSDGLVLSWNSSAERVFGWPAEDVVGKPLPIVPEDKRDEFDALRRRVMSGEGFSGVELTRLKKDGTRIDISLSAALVRNDRGEAVGIMSAAEDITETKRAEQEREKMQAQLIQAQKMESVGRLAGGVAHDYNNMLNVIIGYAELALGKMKPGDPLQENLKEIRTAANRSVEITRQLLAFARKQTISPEVLDLNETVEGMLKMLRRLIGEDIDLAWIPGEPLWPVKIDRAQVNQILANLCVNARDAIAGVGRITIETKTVRFDEAYCNDHAGFVQGEFVNLTVSDDGRGMAPETLDNVFEPFFSTKGVGEGSGLGLATVYGIVKQNDGFINVYSEPGKGATVKVYLPRSEGRDERPRPQKVVEAPRGQGETVLLVEDEVSILKLGGKMLGKLGYKVLEASGPKAAMALAQEHAGEIHLLITDVVMPEMNGRDLAGHLQSLYPRIKVLFMSGYTANAIAHRGVLDDGVCFLQKPFSMEDMASKVREALERTL